MNDDWICGRLGEDEPWALGAVNPPVFENSLFTFETAGDLAEAIKDEDERYVYWRGTNPTVDLAQRKLAALERAERAKCFGSGMGAISATVSSLVSGATTCWCWAPSTGPPRSSFATWRSSASRTHMSATPPVLTALSERTREYSTSSRPPT
ncbi:PLP-dependent transferase [Nonomuraea recticatena]|uniref:PLP-dependent transferase n=1 Tax=Nonomuraea recticatena TaxID=46178 RepID=UPI003616A305